MPLGTMLERSERASQLHVEDNPELKIPTGHITPPNITRHERMLDKWPPESWHRPPPPREPVDDDAMAKLHEIISLGKPTDCEAKGVNALARLTPAWDAPVRCPHTGLRTRLRHVIITLNDGAGWSREKIAAWIDSLDAEGVDTHLVEPAAARGFRLGDLMREGAAVTRALRRAETADDGRAACAQGAAYLAAVRRGWLD